MATASVSELGRVLHEEHFWTLMLVNRLEERIAGSEADRPIDPNDAGDREQLDELISLLDDTARHHAFEERLLFPLIRERCGNDVAKTLTEEHSAMGPMSKRLRTIAADILRSGVTAERWQAFRTAGQEFAAYVMLHLQKEELALVQKLGEMLDPETDHVLAERYGKIGHSESLASIGRGLGSA